MNNVIINSKSITLPNPFEIESFVSGLTISQDDFFYRLKKDIESLYYSIFKKNNYNSRFRFFIQSQILVDKSYEYLLNENERDFGKHTKNWRLNKLEIDKIISKYENEGSYENIYSFDFPCEEEDCMQFFYKFSFSTFFGERYLQNLFDMCPKVFRTTHFNQDELKKLHHQLKENYKKDYDKAYNLFKDSL